MKKIIEAENNQNNGAPKGKISGDINIADVRKANYTAYSSLINKVANYKSNLEEPSKKLKSKIADINVSVCDFTTSKKTTNSLKKL
jgi:hypothetical protein